MNIETKLVDIYIIIIIIIHHHLEYAVIIKSD